MNGILWACSLTTDFADFADEEAVYPCDPCNPWLNPVRGEGASIVAFRWIERTELFSVRNASSPLLEGEGQGEGKLTYAIYSSGLPRKVFARLVHASSIRQSTKRNSFRFRITRQVFANPCCFA